ncbi:hypothetical protein [Vreelandella lutescens]|uniref:Uncharacterized protein n=1 Tax=Vreelandella lutescens TaxID=1602943 RepID=A0ABQ1NNG4_9GAMM|nr:hypothetical protein [Halomonas lutescens]GGC79502.1 hypothetical protein GCM10011382_06840 [Halomonas lutescens]
MLREVLYNSGLIEALEDNPVDRRQSLRIRHSLASQLRTLVNNTLVLTWSVPLFLASEALILVGDAARQPLPVIQSASS